MLDGRSYLTGTLKCIFGKARECIDINGKMIKIDDQFYWINCENVFDYTGKVGYWQIIKSGCKLEIVGFVELKS